MIPPSLGSKWIYLRESLLLDREIGVQVDVRRLELLVAEGIPGLSSIVVVDNRAPPTVSAVAPRVPFSLDILIDYSLADLESDTCTILVEISTDMESSPGVPL